MSRFEVQDAGFTRPIAPTERRYIPGAGPLDRLNVRTIVGGDPNLDPRVVGAVLHPTRDVIVGSVSGTPAARYSQQELEELIGMRWATLEEAAECNQGPPGLDTGPLDGRVQVDALRRLT